MPPSPRDEYVMVFPTQLLHDAGYFQGLQVGNIGLLETILEPNNHTFMKRSVAETDESVKQLIVYVILACDDQVFKYRRGKLLAEKRLLGEYSIGIGGHVSIDDPQMFGTQYEDAMQRELQEEVQIHGPYQISTVGLINDDSNEVGRVHLGVVHVAFLDRPSVTSKEMSINEAGFATPEYLLKNKAKFENWSQICIASLDELLTLGAR